MPARLAVAITPQASCRQNEAENLARRLDLPMADLRNPDYDHFLVLTSERLELRRTGPRAPGSLFVDFIGGAAGYRRRQHEGSRQPLARAAGLKPGHRPEVLDATAGLGRDAFVLATLGCRLRLIERSPVIAALLADGLARASADPATGAIAARIELVTGDSIQMMEELTAHKRPAVVYLDPMFPHRDKSALVKKEMRLLREVAGDDYDAPLLLAKALSCAGGRVVVKRPRLALVIAGPPPQGAIHGKNSRYDIYLTSKDTKSKEMKDPSA
jgi:16S rRNA (guanine1516-N2)-methyltransferase